MPRSAVQAVARQESLRQMLARGQEVSTAALAERFDVDAITIRRDLQRLERDGLAVRRYGGAITAQRISFEFQFDQRHQTNLEQKRRIGAAAAARIGEAETVFLDTGTTTLEIARALRQQARACTVITSSLVIASELWASTQVDLMLLGGTVRHGSPDLVGAATEFMLDRLTGDVAFLGSEGMDSARGSFATDLETARIAERMAANARRVVIVADASKVGLAGTARYAAVTDIDELITDRGADRAAVAALRRRGMTVTLV